jgi:hypothetical protein
MDQTDDNRIFNPFMQRAASLPSTNEASGGVA